MQRRDESVIIPSRHLVGCESQRMKVGLDLVPWSGGHARSETAHLLILRYDQSRNGRRNSTIDSVCVAFRC